MKTEPIDAMRERIKKLFEITAEDVTAIEANARRNEVIAIAAFKKGQSYPKIKQLEWEERKYCYVARTAFGFYRILDVSTLEKKQSCALYFGETAQKVSIGTYEECIKDAQADFEKRVKECLIIE